MIPRTGSGRGAVLTGQEHEIAELAAAGLTTKQITQRLFISHRTVGAHLYQICPKLGIASRVALGTRCGGWTRGEARPARHPRGRSRVP
ncbi:helix-turn-helix transcriptional regulator [Streptomyces sp. NPDC093516]|uniref:response regulator transcription factor n=1 Tax=Streptomyces sp. NPDC093516 TaxID=3155304 RepID=UPI00344889BD